MVHEEMFEKFALGSSISPKRRSRPPSADLGDPSFQLPRSVPALNHHDSHLHEGKLGLHGELYAWLFEYLPNSKQHLSTV